MYILRACSINIIVFVYNPCMAVSLLCVVLFLDPMSELNASALIKLKGKLKLNVKMTELADILETQAGGFMSRTEAQRVRAKIGEEQQMEEVISILLGKGNTEFATFCQMLQKCNYAVWAHKLESEAKSIQKTSVGMKHHLKLLHAFLLLCGAVAATPMIFFHFCIAIWLYDIWRVLSIF